MNWRESPYEPFVCRNYCWLAAWVHSGVFFVVVATAFDLICSFLTVRRSRWTKQGKKMKMRKKNLKIVDSFLLHAVFSSSFQLFVCKNEILVAYPDWFFFLNYEAISKVFCSRLVEAFITNCLISLSNVLCRFNFINKLASQNGALWHVPPQISFQYLNQIKKRCLDFRVNEPCASVRTYIHISEGC